MGDEEFESTISSVSTTKDWKRSDDIVEGRKIAIVDTPGFFDTQNKNVFTQQDLEKCVYLLHPGPHAIIFVIRVGKITPEEKETIEMVKKFFRNEGKDFLIILFTGKDRLVEDGKTLEGFLADARKDGKEGKELNSLLATAKHRYVAFNNKAEGEEKSQQVKDLIKMTDELVKGNGAKPCYTHALYKQDTGYCAIM